MVGLVKQALYKFIGKACIQRKELQGVLLDIELVLNNRLLSYVEDDIQMTILTPNNLMFGQPGQQIALMRQALEREQDMLKNEKRFVVEMVVGVSSGVAITP